MHRRRFLASVAALPALGIAGKLFAAPLSSPRFLFVFLRGGYDCANMLIPYSSDFYYESRPKIAIAKPDPSNPAGALSLDSTWALTPALRDSIGAMYTNKQVAFIPFAGTEDLSRSHFETQDNIEIGLPPQQRGFGSGFLARLATTLQGKSKPIAFTDALPLTLRGGGDVPNISLRSVGKAGFDERQSAILVDMYKGSSLQPAVSSGLQLRAEVAQEFGAEMVKANRGAVNARGFAAQTDRLAELMRDRYRIGFVDIGGWDTHVNEGGAQGQLANNLANLGEGLQTFARALGDEWKNTVVVVMSEFGRTFRENGNQGTDHGHGSVHWVLGGSIAGGRIAGEQIVVKHDTLLQNRDYPVLNNYRGSLASVFRGMWGLSSMQIAQIFPATTISDLRLI
ncbi:MAG: DUF1501 domain-containing protein [Rudaea sp.]